MTHRESQKKYVSLSLGTVLMTALVFAAVSACTDQQAKAKPNFVYKEAPKPGLVAKIGGEEITEEQLIGDDKLDFFDLKKREYELKMERLNKLIVDKLIGAEAKKAGMSTEEYINKKIIGGDSQDLATRTTRSSSPKSTSPKARSIRRSRNASALSADAEEAGADHGPRRKAHQEPAGRSVLHRSLRWK